jgi:alcohol dehydrogenase (cytochrome c)
MRAVIIIFVVVGLAIAGVSPDWLGYHGDETGRRFSPLAQVNTANVRRLAAAWTFQFVRAPVRSEATPLVRDGIMYITVGGEEAWALDARTGRPFWSFEYATPSAGSGAGTRRTNWNRGLALSNHRLFMATSDCALIALDARNGSLLWRVQLADPAGNYGSTAAPLVVKNLVLIGVRGGDTGTVRGFIDAIDVETGKRAWRFYTVPAPGEPGSETWPKESAVWKSGGVATWTTGTYDPDLNLIYWTTGNPGPRDFDGRNRPGDNLYSCSVLALNPETGKLVWHYQFSPHDWNDWDANETPVLADAAWLGTPRKLLLHANRNGFFYVLDRRDGRFLLAEPFSKVNWAKRIGPDGRPERVPGMEPTGRGIYTCPDVHGGTNWQAPGYNPSTGLFYVIARDACGYFYPTGSANDSEKMAPEQSVKAIDIQTGKMRWKYSFAGNQEAVNHAGLMTTAGGLVFAGGRDGQLIALNARDGKELWHFNTGGSIRSSPISYAVDGKQYIALYGKAAVFTFALLE